MSTSKSDSHQNVNGEPVWESRDYLIILKFRNQAVMITCIFWLTENQSQNLIFSLFLIKNDSETYECTPELM